MTGGKGRGRGIPRARRDKDLKEAERMERKRGDQTSRSKAQEKAAAGGEMGGGVGTTGAGAYGTGSQLSSLAVACPKEQIFHPPPFVPHPPKQAEFRS